MYGSNLHQKNQQPHRSAASTARVPILTNLLRASLITILGLLPVGCGGDASTESQATETPTTDTASTEVPSTEVVDIWTPAAMGAVPTLAARLEKSGNPDELDPTFGVSALEFAADFGHIDAMKTILEAGGTVNVRNRSRGTALIGAAFLGRLECVKFLLEAGADPTAMNNDRLTALTALDVPWEYTQPIIELLQMPLDRAVLENGRRACRPIIEAALK